MVATMTKRYGSYEGFQQFMRGIAARGGSRSGTGGFADPKVGADGLTGKERARTAGALGGRVSKRKAKCKHGNRNLESIYVIAETVNSGKVVSIVYGCDDCPQRWTPTQLNEMHMAQLRKQKKIIL